MREAGLARSTGSPDFVPLKAPFSNFDFVDDRFGGETAIRRLFSQARSHGAKTLILETIRPEGAVRSENEEIRTRYPAHEMSGLLRLSFWRNVIKSENRLAACDSADLLGYVIAKKDRVPSIDKDDWHVFEAVFRKYDHNNNCVPREVCYPVRVGSRELEIPGVLYGQQNGLNKACAQVALRSLCSLHLPLRELTYDRINRIAATVRGRYDPSEGLSVRRIRAVLNAFGISFSDIDYSKEDAQIRKDIPYQKLIYSGIESGAGALLGFRMATRKKGQLDHHSIPFFGHTFNQDTWVANATSAYFRVGTATKYLPSETWLSSFIGHDDNFGSNFCVPRLFLKPLRVKYALAILPRGVKYDGIRAETIASDYLYSLKRNEELAASDSPWVKRFYRSSDAQEVILRAVALSKEDYITHLTEMRDWNNKRFPSTIREFAELLSDHLWMVEISLPELFPINKRKLGEIVLDATKSAKAHRDYKAFLFARFPSQFFFVSGKTANHEPNFLQIPSQIESHTELYMARKVIPVTNRPKRPR